MAHYQYAGSKPAGSIKPAARLQLGASSEFLGQKQTIFALLPWVIYIHLSLGISSSGNVGGHTASEVPEWGSVHCYSSSIWCRARNVGMQSMVRAPTLEFRILFDDAAKPFVHMYMYMPLLLDVPMKPLSKP